MANKAPEDTTNSTVPTQGKADDTSEINTSAHDTAVIPRFIAYGETDDRNIAQNPADLTKLTGADTVELPTITRIVSIPQSTIIPNIDDTNQPQAPATSPFFASMQTSEEFPNQVMLRAYPDLFPKKLTDVKPISKYGLCVLSIRAKDSTEVIELLKLIERWSPDAFCVGIHPDSQTADGGYFIDYIDKVNSAKETARIINETRPEFSTRIGAEDSQLAITYAGINAFGEGLEALHADTQPRETQPYDKRLDLDTENIDTSKLGLKQPEFRLKRTFVAEIRLLNNIGTAQRAIQQAISTIATKKYGCTVLFHNNNIIIFNQSERPVSIGNALRDEIIPYLKEHYGDEFDARLTHAELQYETPSESTTQKLTEQSPIESTRARDRRVIAGEFIKKLREISAIPGTLTTDESMIPFENETRYFDLGLRLKRVQFEDETILVVDEEKAELELLERGFVGRESEIQLLKGIIQQTKEHAKIIELRGPAGIGKTELLHYTMPKDTIKIRPGEGRSGLEIANLGTAILQYLEAHNITGTIPIILEGAKNYFKSLNENLDLLDEEDFVNHATYALQVISGHIQNNGENDFFGLMIDDLDDIKPPAFAIIHKIICAIKAKKTSYKNIVVGISRRSDIAYSEHIGGENTNVEDISRHLSLTFITQLMVDQDGHIQICPLELGKDKNNQIEYSKWLADFIVGRVLQKTDNGVHLGKSAATTVKNLTLIGNLLYQMAGKKNEDGTIDIVPKYMVHAVNELILRGYLQYDAETNEINLTNYEQAKDIMPDEPEGLHAMLFERLTDGEQKTICAFYILEGMNSSILGELTKKVGNNVGLLGLFEKMQEDREILNKSDTITMNRHWTIFIKKYLAQHPEIEINFRAIIATALLEILKQSAKQVKINPITLFNLTEEYAPTQDSELADIITQNALNAAKLAIENYQYATALKCAKRFIQTKNAPDSETFEAYMIAIKTCVGQNNTPLAAQYYQDANHLNLDLEQKRILAETALQSSYHAYKHKQIKSLKDVDEELDNYDNRLREATEQDNQDNKYTKALLLHHKANALKERMYSGKYDHSKHAELYGISQDITPTTDELYIHAIKLAQKAQSEIDEFDENTAERWEKELTVTNLNLLCVLHLELVRSWYNKDNMPIIEASENGDEKVLSHLSEAEKLAEKSLRISAKYRIFEPETKARSALNRLMATMYQGKTEELERLINNSIAQMGFAHESTRKSMQIHIGVTALDLYRVKANMPDEIKKLLLGLNMDTNADIYSEAQDNPFNAYNYAESCIFSSLQQDVEQAEKTLKKAIDILTPKATYFLASQDYLGHFIEIIAQHAIAAKSVGIDKFILDYKGLLTEEIIQKYIEHQKQDQDSPVLQLLDIIKT